MHPIPMIVRASITTSTCSGKKKETRMPTPKASTAIPIVLHSINDFITFSSCSVGNGKCHTLCYYPMHSPQER